MRVRRGDVVLVDYLFSDRTGSKIRPCLVVQNDANNQRLDDTIVVAISSKVARANTAPTQVLIEISTKEGAQSGLLFDSAIQCENLATIDTQFVIRKIGSIPLDTMRHIDDGLKMSLGLS
jgi:mRNA interferase MazF